MRKSQFTESQIVQILTEGEAGVRVADLFRKHGISRGTYFKWKRKYRGRRSPSCSGSRSWRPRMPGSSVCRPGPGERRHQGRA